MLKKKDPYLSWMTMPLQLQHLVTLIENWLIIQLVVFSFRVLLFS